MKIRVAGSQIPLNELGRIFSGAPQPIQFSGPATTENSIIPGVSTTAAPVDVTTVVKRRVLLSKGRAILQVSHDDLSEETLKYFESKGFSIEEHRDGINITAPTLQ